MLPTDMRRSARTGWKIRWAFGNSEKKRSVRELTSCEDICYCHLSLFRSALLKGHGSHVDLKDVRPTYLPTHDAAIIGELLPYQWKT
jgi:hypothetical protein